MLAYSNKTIFFFFREGWGVKPDHQRNLGLGEGNRRLEGEE